MKDMLMSSKATTDVDPFDNKLITLRKNVNSTLDIYRCEDFVGGYYIININLLSGFGSNSKIYYTCIY